MELLSGSQYRTTKLEWRCLGLGNIKPLAGLPPDPAPSAAFGRCTLASPGKDTTTGHWEMAGVILERAFPTFPHGFPAEVIAEYERRIGRKTIGNKAPGMPAEEFWKKFDAIKRGDLPR